MLISTVRKPYKSNVYDSERYSAPAISRLYGVDIPAYKVAETLSRMYDNLFCSLRLSLQSKQVYLITAIIDTHFDFDKYYTLKNVLLNSETNLAESFQKEVNCSLHNFFLSII